MSEWRYGKGTLSITSNSCLDPRIWASWNANITSNDQQRWECDETRKARLGRNFSTGSQNCVFYRYVLAFKSNICLTNSRSSRAWTISQNDFIRPHFRCSFLRHFNSWCKCWIDWNVQGTSGNSSSSRRSSSCLYNKGWSVSWFYRRQWVTLLKIDMTPAPKLEETLKQVTKILQSPGCRLVVKVRAGATSWFFG